MSTPETPREAAKPEDTPIVRIPLADLVELFNEHSAQNDAARDKLQGVLARSPELAETHPGVIAKIGSTAATSQILGDLKGLILSAAAQQHGQLDHIESLLWPGLELGETDPSALDT